MLSGSGIGEWARQWLVVNPKRSMRDGRMDLLYTVGGNEGFHRDGVLSICEEQEDWFYKLTINATGEEEMKNGQLEKAKAEILQGITDAGNFKDEIPGSVWSDPSGPYGTR